jgi:hypothetical protein
MEVLEEKHNMPYTLRRPMFRGGKPNAYGTGITSNLESRRGFANGPEEEMLSPDVTVDPQVREAYARNYGENIREQMTPSRKEQVLDFLRAFGASAAPAGEFQTLGSALGKTGVNFESIYGPKLQAARKAGTEGYLAALKGVDEEKLLEYEKLARDAYNVGMYPTYDKALEAVVKEKILGKPKDYTQKTFEEYRKYYLDRGNEPSVAALLANIDLKADNDPSFRSKLGSENFKGPINFRQFERTEDGQFKLTNPNFKPRTNETFVDQYTGRFYIFNGKTLVELEI